jgi:hypothetical protein
MHVPKRSFHFLLLICAGLALLAGSGCVTLSTKTLTNGLVYQPERSPVQIDACAAVEATDVMDADLRSVWKHWMNTDQSIANWEQGVAGVVASDITDSGLFTRMATPGGPKPDYLLVIRSEESRPSDFKLRMTVRLLDFATRRELAAFARETSVGTSLTDYDMKAGLQRILVALKADVAANLQEKVRHQQELAAQEEAELLTKASLSDLLAGSDRSVVFARARNRALVAARELQLPALLRDRKTDELSALVVKIEQTILDLDHECEVAKDQVQQSAAGSGAPETMPRGGGRGMASQAANSTSLDELRGLAICYRERIELLKPIAAALREEIANRNR